MELSIKLTIEMTPIQDKFHIMLREGLLTSFWLGDRIAGRESQKYVMLMHAQRKFFLIDFSLIWPSLFYVL